MNFSIIGTGNTAWFLAKRLTEAGHNCEAVYGRNTAHTTLLAQEVNAKAFDLNNISDDTDVCIIAISDHAIADIVKNISFKNAVLLHTAGAVDMAILSDAANNYGVIWPMYSIVKNNLPQTRNIPAIWEASSDKAAQIIQTIASSFTDTTHETSSEQRKWLHLTAVLSNNFTNHLFTISEQLCKEHNLPFNILLPIIEQSVSRLHNASPYEQQTGPAKRNDEPTLQRQATMLSEHPQWQELYIKLSQSIRDMYNKG
ncbi:MAG: DUF2520 domain-containing protein [Bacteroidetes bacterium]|nr:DUF2520 domain-containing protein [Bacteroidota bacterium]